VYFIARLVDREARTGARRDLREESRDGLIDASI
jgi:hypothetical protein